MNKIKPLKGDIDCFVLQLILDFKYIEKFEDIADHEIDDLICDLKPDFEEIKDVFMTKDDIFDEWFDYMGDDGGDIWKAVRRIHMFATIVKRRYKNVKNRTKKFTIMRLN